MLCLRWSLDQGFVPVPKASSPARLAENLRALAMPPLSAAERASLEEYVRERGGERADPMLRLIAMVQPAGAEPYTPPPPRARSDRETEVQRIRMMGAD